MVCKPDNSVNVTTATALSNFFEPNPFSTVIDYHSSRDAEYFTSYKVVKSGQVSLVPDSLTSQIAFAQRKIPLKLNHHQKFNTDVSATNSFFSKDSVDNEAIPSSTK